MDFYTRSQQLLHGDSPQALHERLRTLEEAFEEAQTADELHRVLEGLEGLEESFLMLNESMVLEGPRWDRFKDRVTNLKNNVVGALRRARSAIAAPFRRAGAALRRGWERLTGRGTPDFLADIEAANEDEEPPVVADAAWRFVAASWAKGSRLGINVSWTPEEDGKGTLVLEWIGLPSALSGELVYATHGRYAVLTAAMAERRLERSHILRRALASLDTGTESRPLPLDEVQHQLDIIGAILLDDGPVPPYRNGV